jgi:hypothetical protein
MFLSGNSPDTFRDPYRFPSFGIEYETWSMALDVNGWKTAANLTHFAIIMIAEQTKLTKCTRPQASNNTTSHHKQNKLQGL